MTALAALTAADLRALADVEEPRFAQYWASGVWFHAGDSGGWRGIGWAVWMECAARAWIPPHAGSLTAWGVTDGRALVHLTYDEDEARSWAVDARAEHRNRQMPPPVYSVVRLSVAGDRAAQSEAASAGYCERAGGCVCGGDLPRVREGCSEWVKSGAAQAHERSISYSEGYDDGLSAARDLLEDLRAKVERLEARDATVNARTADDQTARGET